MNNRKLKMHVDEVEYKDGVWVPIRMHGTYNVQKEEFTNVDEVCR